MIDEFYLIDIWRLLNPTLHRFTRREMTRGGLVQSRLDYWLISEHLLYNLHDQKIVPGIKSDHSIVKFSLKINDSLKRGRGFFKFNSQLLKDRDYVYKVKRLINQAKEDHDVETNHGLLCDTIKCEIRGFTIGYSSAKRKREKEFEKDLKDRLSYLEIN